MKGIWTIFEVLGGSEKHQCFILISDGSGTPPTFEHWALLAVQTHLAKMGLCLCARCVSIGPINSNYSSVCSKLHQITPLEPGESDFYMNLGPDLAGNIESLAEKISNWMISRILWHCKCKCVNMPFMPPQ